MNCSVPTTISCYQGEFDHARASQLTLPTFYNSSSNTDNDGNYHPSLPYEGNGSSNESDNEELLDPYSYYATTIVGHGMNNYASATTKTSTNVHQQQRHQQQQNQSEDQVITALKAQVAWQHDKLEAITTQLSARDVEIETLKAENKRAIAKI